MNESNGLTVITPMGRLKAKGLVAIASCLLLAGAVGVGWAFSLDQQKRAAEHWLISEALNEQTKRLESIFWAVLLGPGQRKDEIENLPLPSWVQELRDKRARDEWLKKQPAR